MQFTVTRHFCTELHTDKGCRKDRRNFIYALQYTYGNRPPFTAQHRLAGWHETHSLTLRWLMSYIYIYMEHPFLMFLDHTQRRTTVGRTPLDEWSARRRDLYLTTHNTHNRQTSMPLVGFEPMISAGERPQAYVLDRAATGTGNYYNIIL